MSDLHELCEFKERPITDKYVEILKLYLKAGIPATYTLEEAEDYENGIERAEQTSTTTPLHIICENIPDDATEEEQAIIVKMMDELLLNGAGWCLTNKNDETPGCVLARRGLHGSKYWDTMVDAGVRAELLFRKLEAPTVEFVDESDVDEEDKEELEALSEAKETAEVPELVETKDEAEEKEPDAVAEETEAAAEETEAGPTIEEGDPTRMTDTYLKTPLEYKDGALVTSERGDGVMMQWEEDLMKAGRDSLFKSIEDPEDINVVNIGFGMGIIDSLIQEKNPTKHYICEAHPDVLKKMEADGWMDKPNVVVLKGKWQDTLPPLLGKGVFFDGIYYDTYSEHYQDMLELYDLTVGLLKPKGTFSFFNGLGADRLVCYEVYQKVVDLDLMDYGLQVEYTEMTPPKNVLKDEQQDDSVWKGIKRAYWTCPTYYHPEIHFAY